MKKNKFVFLMILVLLSNFSFSNNNNNDLEITKTRVINSINQELLYLDSLIKDNENKVLKQVIINKYGWKIYNLEVKILNDFKKIVDVHSVKESDFREWLSKIKYSKLQEKYLVAKNFGFDFKEIPLTTNYQLTQFYKDSVENFSIKLPSDWTTQNYINKKGFTSVGPLVSDSNLILYHNGAFGLGIYNYEKTYSTEEYFYGNIQPMKEENKSFVVLEEKDIKLHGINAKFIVFKSVIKEKALVHIQIYFTNNKKGYIFAGATLENIYEKHRELYVEIFKTFEF